MHKGLHASGTLGPSRQKSVNFPGHAARRKDAAPQVCWRGHIYLSHEVLIILRAQPLHFLLVRGLCGTDVLQQLPARWPAKAGAQAHPEGQVPSRAARAQSGRGSNCMGNRPGGQDRGQTQPQQAPGLIIMGMLWLHT